MSTSLEVVSANADHFWYRPRSYLLTKIISENRFNVELGPLLDLGCGTQAVFKDMEGDEYDLIGVDQVLHKNSAGQAPIVQANLERLPFADNSVPAVALFDVLEHMNEDIALQEIRRTLVKGGFLYLSVPAFSWLWSDRDVAAGHLRRYSRQSLLNAIERNGFDPINIAGYQFFLLPVFVVSRYLGRFFGGRPIKTEDTPSYLVNKLLHAVNHLEVNLPRMLRPKIGSSLILVARKI